MLAETNVETFNTFIGQAIIVGLDTFIGLALLK